MSRGQAPDWTEIDAQLEREFLTWQQRIREAADRLRQAEQRLESSLEPGEEREFKKLYHALVKRLHPDVNPGLDDAARRRWQRVQDAHECGDLEELRALAALDEPPGTPSADQPPEALQRLCGTLRRQIEAVEERLDRLESEPPFTLRDELDDDAWVEARRAGIEAQTAQHEARRAALCQTLETLYPHPAHEPKFSLN